jgi:hypothetical protein
MVPTNKVLAGGASGAIAVIVVWGMKAVGHIDVPPEIAVAISTLSTFFIQYCVPDAEA